MKAIIESHYVVRIADEQETLTLTSHDHAAGKLVTKIDCLKGYVKQLNQDKAVNKEPN